MRGRGRKDFFRIFFSSFLSRSLWGLSSWAFRKIFLLPLRLEFLGLRKKTLPCNDYNKPQRKPDRTLDRTHNFTNFKQLHGNNPLIFHSHSSQKIFSPNILTPDPDIFPVFTVGWRNHETSFGRQKLIHSSTNRLQ